MLEQAAASLAVDVAAFDQRGCLSPRIAFVEGRAVRARAFGLALHAALTALDARAPRGELGYDESVEAVRWRDTLAFAGELWTGAGHAVGFTSAMGALAVPPAGRNVLLLSVSHLSRCRAPSLRWLPSW